MIRTAGNQAFRALANVLKLPGSEHLATIDIGVASPVLELGPVVQAGVVERWELAFDVRGAAPGTEEFVLLPVTGTSAPILAAMKNGVRAATVPTADELNSRDLWIHQAGVFDIDNDMTFGQFYWQFDTQARMYLMRLATASGHGAGYLRLGTDLFQPFPWFRPAQSSSDAPALKIARGLTAGGATTTTAYLRLFAAPPGAIPYQ